MTTESHKPLDVFADLPDCFVTHAGPIIDGEGGPMAQTAEVTYLLRDDGFLVHLRLAVENGRPEIVHLSFVAVPGYDQVITQPWVRKLDLNGIRDAAITAMLRDAKIKAFVRGGKLPTPDDLLDVGPVSRSRRRVITDDLLREVADVVNADTTGKPTWAVARHFPTSHRNATRWVGLARKGGFLTDDKGDT